LEHPYFAEVRTAEYEAAPTGPVWWGDMDSRTPTSATDIRTWILEDLVSGG
jgi:hypothetical protein